MREKIDTVLNFMVSWNESSKISQDTSRTLKLKQWIQLELETNNFELIEKYEQK